MRYCSHTKVTNAGCLGNRKKMHVFLNAANLNMKHFERSNYFCIIRKTTFSGYILYSDRLNWVTGSSYTAYNGYMEI